MRKAFLPTFLLTLLLLPGAILADEPLLILTEQLYPLNYTANGEDHEEVLGFATNLVVAVMEESGLDYELNMVPWARAMNSINNNPNVLVYCMSRSPIRGPSYQWIGEIWSAKIVLYGHRKRITHLPLDLEDLKILKVGTPRQSVTRDYLKTFGFENIVTVKTMDSYLRLLERGRIDLFPFLGFSVNMFARRQNFDLNNLISVVELTEIPLSLSLAASKTMNVHKVRRLQTAFSKVKRSGQYDEIMAPLKTMIDKFN